MGLCELVSNAGEVTTETEWPNGSKFCSVAHSVIGLNIHQCLWRRDLQVCELKMLRCYARCKVNLRSSLFLKFRTDYYTRNLKQEYQSPTKKDSCPPNI